MTRHLLFQRVTSPSGVAGLLSVASMSSTAHAAAAPTHFAGEALTVAIAFAFPALVAGGYLALERLRNRFGSRAIAALGTVTAAVGVSVFFADDVAGLARKASLVLF